MDLVGKDLGREVADNLTYLRGIELDRYHTIPMILEHLDEAVEAKPGDVGARYLRAALRSTGSCPSFGWPEKLSMEPKDAEKQLEDLDVVVAARPGDGVVRVLRAEALCALGRKEEAQGELKAAQCSGRELEEAANSLMEKKEINKLPAEQLAVLLLADHQPDSIMKTLG